jgi:membrane fusion protein (multidrug efflux system)
VKEGRTRGEQVAIIKGVSEGDEVVTSGQLKLKNGYQVTIDNSVVPSDNPAPTLPNDH